MQESRVRSSAEKFATLAFHFPGVENVRTRVRNEKASVWVTADGSEYNELRSLASRTNMKFVEKPNDEDYLFRYTAP